MKMKKKKETTFATAVDIVYMYISRKIDVMAQGNTTN